MNKKLDWNNIYNNPFDRARAKTGTYSSGKEYMQKAFEAEKHQEDAQNLMKKALPAMQALLKCRLESKTPLTVLRPFAYMTSELIKSYNQIWSNEEGGWVDDLDSPRSSQYQDVRKVLNSGTKLILKSLDPNLQEFIFEDSYGHEVVLPYSAKDALMTNTNIYEDVKSFIKNQGE